MRRLFIVLPAVFFIGISCTDPDDNVNAVHIRVRNVSNLLFDEVQVGDAEEAHLNVAPDDYSDYLEYETAYSYAFIEIKSDSTTYTFQPFDFVGATELPIGFYTYELNITPEGDVALDFKID
jgi:hypothetical protein